MLAHDSAKAAAVEARLETSFLKRAARVHLGDRRGERQTREEMKKNPDMEHDDPNAKRVKPKQKSEIV